MSEARRRKPTNRWGCKPVEDVCVEHDTPLECRHGCTEAREHKCKDKVDRANDEQAAKDFNDEKYGD